ncbi:VOC family protein [Catenovulum agarivorans]|uniref:VOC family protein n=1 Tax=Catenovulum agarivorans TaxID=1172192 RepID=UPI000360EE4E|nr:VOC family protein [Catenovulum agarivorans]
MRFNHFNLNVSAEQIEQVKQFYCDLFGLVQGYRPNTSRPGYWLYAGEQPILHLNQIVDIDKTTAAGSHYSLDHMAFNLPNMADFVNKLTKLNVTYDKRIYADRPSQIFLYDPAGVKIEVQFEIE